MVFIWRAPRSSRVSRDWEKLLSFFFDAGGAGAALLFDWAVPDLEAGLFFIEDILMGDELDRID